MTTEQSAPLLAVQSDQTRRLERLAWLGAGLLCIITLYVHTIIPSIGDERHHWPQIERFRDGHWDWSHPGLAMPLTYHAIVGHVARWLGLETLFAYRCVSIMLSLPGIYLLYRLMVDLPSADRTWRTLALLAFPPYFQHFFLAYTDGLGTSLVIGSFLAAKQKRLVLSAALAVAAMAVRQNNIIWLLLIHAQTHFESQGWNLSVRALIQGLRISWPFLVGEAIFGAFLVINKGLVVGDHQMHSPSLFQSENITAALLMLLFFLLPVAVENRRRLWTCLISPPTLAILLAFLVFHLLTFRFDNPYHNVMLDSILNGILLRVRWGGMERMVMLCIPLAVALLLICSIRLRRPTDYLIYPAFLLYLMPNWMVSTRYSIVPFALVLVCAAPTDLKAAPLAVSVIVMASINVMCLWAGWYI